MNMNVYVLIVRYMLQMSNILCIFALCITVLESNIYNKLCTQMFVLKSYIHCFVQNQQPTVIRNLACYLYQFFKIKKKIS